MLPGVFAVGHLAPWIVSELWSAVLYAGPGAMLSHITAAWWLGLIDRPGQAIHVSTPRRCRPHPAVRAHARRTVSRTMHLGLPVSTLPHTMLDLAASEPAPLLRHALAQLDYRGQLDPQALLAACGRGMVGASALRAALAVHLPALARANGALEVDFLLLCERYGIPLPAVNVRVCGILVDCFWPAARLVAELDGLANHSSPAQLRRDRERELILRAHGFRVIRYSYEQVHTQPEMVRDDLLAQLAAVA